MHTRLISEILRPLTILALVSSTWRLKLPSMILLRATRRTRNLPIRFLPSTRTGLRLCGITKTVERSVSKAQPRLPDTDLVTTKLIAVRSSSTKVSNRVVVVMVTMVLSSKLLIKVMAINKLLKVKIRAHRQHLRIRILRLPPLLKAKVMATVKDTDTDTVSAATVVFPLFPLFVATKAMDSTPNRLLVNMDSSNSKSSSRSNIPARTSTTSVSRVSRVSSMAEVLIKGSRIKVMVVVDMVDATEQVKCF